MTDTDRMGVAAVWDRIRRDADVIAAHLTEMLPADLRAAGVRFEWAEEER